MCVCKTPLKPSSYRNLLGITCLRHVDCPRTGFMAEMLKMLANRAQHPYHDGERPTFILTFHVQTGQKRKSAIRHRALSGRELLDRSLSLSY